MSRVARGAAALAALALLLSGCGVPLSDSADPIPEIVRPSASPSATESSPSASPDVTTPVWFVDGTILVPRDLKTPAPATTEAALGLLAAPPDGESLRTLIPDPLGGNPLATLVTPADSTVTPADQQVLLSPTFSELAAEDQVLLIGQVVLTLTEIDPRPLQFVDSTGASLSVPLPGGRLRDGPVSRQDYLPLTTPSPTPTTSA